ncbi:PilZ domain-containing protein [Aquibacillus saliphilus]|uniref:PilZ domain-containing protein n=1 Tax=Aquibacillus saliphilus TaxID=1909422 RepID=UPI001CF05EE2|nr:PilZ domain-containing protein [Aquibacillus saliphilus]
MYYVIFAQLIIMIVLLTLYLFSKKSSAKSQNSITSHKKTDTTKNTLPNFMELDKREFFRVELIEKNCLVEFIDFENTQLRKLQNKKFDAFIENISLGGMKITCPYNLPVKQSITVQMTFELKQEDFCIQGEIVRKEEHNHKDWVSYGVGFKNISQEEQEQLLASLNKVMIDKNKQIS